MVNGETGRPTNFPVDESDGEWIPCATIWSIGRASGRLPIQKTNLTISRVAHQTADRQFRKDDTELKWGMGEEPVRSVKQ